MATGDLHQLRVLAGGKWDRQTITEKPYGTIGFDRVGQMGFNPGIIWRQVAPVTVTNTATPTTLLGTGSGNKTIIGGALSTDTYIRVTGALSVVYATGTLKIGFHFAGEELRTIGALTPEAADVIFFQFLARPNAIGAAQSLNTHGFYQATTQASAMPAGAGGTLDTSADVAFDLVATWSAADPGNIVLTNHVLVEVIP